MADFAALYSFTICFFIQSIGYRGNRLAAIKLIFIRKFHNNIVMILPTMFVLIL